MPKPAWMSSLCSNRSWTTPMATCMRCRTPLCNVLQKSRHSSLPDPQVHPAAQGNTLGNMRHGWGKHTCANGDKYTGNWRLDKRHGRGRAMFARGVEYEGEWADDKAEGCAGERSARYSANY